MKLEPATLDDIDEADDTAAIVEARAEIAAGQFVGHVATKARLLSWGSPNELPPLKAGE